jgi:hypothetical protein
LLIFGQFKERCDASGSLIVGHGLLVISRLLGRRAAAEQTGQSDKRLITIGSAPAHTPPAMKSKRRTKLAEPRRQ